MHEIDITVEDTPINVSVNPPEDFSVVIEENPVDVSITEQVTQVIVQDEPFVIVFPDPETVGPVGPPGPPGPKGDSGNIITSVAGEPLGSSRLVVKSSTDSKLYYADVNNPDHAYGVFGITRTSALVDQEVQVFISGEIEEVAWNWRQNEPVFMGTNGYLTQDLIPADYFVTVGFAINPRKIFLRIDLPIYLIN